MRYMMMIMSDEATEAGAMPSREIVEAMDRFNSEMMNAGVMLAGEGLHPTSEGARVKYSQGRWTVTDGPFAETKEVVAGYWIIDVESKEEAIEWATRVPTDGTEGPTLHLRRIFEVEEFPEGLLSPEQAAREKALRDESVLRTQPGGRRGSGKSQITARPGSQEMVIVQEFDAPRALVFKAYTDPEMVAQWMGPRRYSMDIETYEPWSGGRWKFSQADEDGNEYRFHGVFHEVRPPERVIQTFEFDGLPDSGHASLETAMFEELPGNRTRVVSQAIYRSVEDRDGMLESGMEEGMDEIYDRLNELLARMQRR